MPGEYLCAGVMGCQGLAWTGIASGLFLAALAAVMLPRVERRVHGPMPSNVVEADADSDDVKHESVPEQRGGLR